LWHFARLTDQKRNGPNSIACAAGSIGFFSIVPDLIRVLLLLVAGGFLVLLALTQLLVRRSMDDGNQG
tara:strand:- start:395 stop:598 length:204 start_codon:yes stop_codon:yes gene_type:complete